MKTTDFARCLSSFLGTYLPGVRNVSINTLRSYRDTFRLLLIFCLQEFNVSPQKVTLDFLTDKTILLFLDWLELVRSNSIATRNQRLAAIHALFRYVQFEEPPLLLQCQKILGIPFKKYAKPRIQHLSPEAVKLLLSQPLTTSSRGRRDLALVSLLYDTGARVQEIVDLRVRDIRLDQPPVIALSGKGRKTRHVPLMTNTKNLLATYMNESQRLSSQGDIPLFVNQQGKRMTRAGIAYILGKYSKQAHEQSEIVPLRVTPHVLRHTKAMHLYQAGVNIVYIRDLLGHVHISSTDIYARADTEMKRKAVEKVYPDITENDLPEWRHDNDLLAWLNHL